MAAATVARCESGDGNFSLRLTANICRFEPVSKVTHVFFDDANKQVFAVRGSGAAGVVIKSPDSKSSFNFRIQDKGPVNSIKFSPELKILAIQRSSSSVEFINIANGEPEGEEYSQICKGKSTKIRGFVWTNLTEIAFVTDHGVELYQVLAEKKTLRLSKTFALNVNWFVYSTIDGLLLLSLGSLGNQMLPLSFKAGNVYKQPKFEVDLPQSRSTRPLLLERDVILANVYGRVYVTVLRHQPRSTGSSGAEVVLYALQKDAPAKKTHILKLDMSGRFAVNVVDNLLVVHNQASKTSAIFDVGLNGESDGYVNYHSPITLPLSIKPFKIKVPVVPTLVLQEDAEVTCEMYSPNWVVFQPNTVIDAKIGCLWHLELCLESLISFMPDTGKLVDFLLCRDPSAKQVLMQVFLDLLLKTPKPSLSLLASLFDRLNIVYRRYLDLEINLNSQALQASSSNNPGVLEGCLPSSAIFVDQSDMYTLVFTVLAEKQEQQAHKFVVAVIMEYIRSLCQYEIAVQYFLYELVINTLVNHRCFYQLHQLLQYQVLSDSKPLACLMLSLEGVYPPAHQLALDMLKRISTANEEIIEVLLSKHMLIPALRFIRNVGKLDSVSARKFLEASLAPNVDPLVFYAVFRFFEQRNIRLRGKPSFAKGEHCEPYTERFEQMFGSLKNNNSQAVVPS